MASLRCRLCEAELKSIFVDLGLTPIANAFVRPENAGLGEKFYPLKARVCDCCHLVQLENFETPDIHFHAEYAYFSSFSETWLDHARTFVERAIQIFGLGSETHVVEVGSNDGYLLQYFVERGIPCLGVDAAANCATAAWKERRVRTEVAFFGTATASRLSETGHAADLMIANNVLAHVPDLNDFVAGFKILLKPEGTAVFEVPHVLELIRNNEFDTIYHEHYFYLSLLALEPLFARHDLKVANIERLPTHGGSLRLYVRHAAASGSADAAVAAVRSEELTAGLDRPEVYILFGERVRAWKTALLDILVPLASEGKRIAGYGAPAKGNTLLNYCGIGTDLVAFTADRNPHKQGMLLPGTHIPIRSPDAILTEKPDFVLILPWNLRDEIMKQLPIRSWGGRFIVPIPWPLILEGP